MRIISKLKRIKKPKFPVLDKRQRFALQTLFLTFGLLLTQIIWEDYRFFMVIVLSVATYVLSVWSLREDIKGNEWVLLFILPVLFTASLSLFYFLLPARWSVRLAILIVFGVGTYAALLVENIYNVAVARSIQLLRAAQSIGLLVTLVVIFLTVNIIFSLRTPFFLNAAFILPAAYILSLQSLWSVNLETKIPSRIYLYSGVISLAIGELIISLSFWPIQTATASLLVAASYYFLIGIFQQHLLDRLFINTVREYFIVLAFTTIVAYLTSTWG